MFFRDAGNLTGTLPIASIPPGVARTSVSNLFSSPNQFNGFVGINRAFAVTGADAFHIGNQPGAGGYIGMYISSSQIGGLPFYGYVTTETLGWTYAAGSTWRLNWGDGDRITVTSQGRVGIGTTALDVRGDVSLGLSGEYQAVGGTERIRVLRGRTLAGGGVFFGSGFTAARLGTGFYRMTFTTPFGATPTVTANAVSSVARIVTVTGTTTTVADLQVFNTSGAGTDADLMVQVIGPR